MLAFFDTLLEAGDQVHIRIWNAMLKACCTHERFDLALDVYYPMLAQFGVRPNTYTYLTIINGLGTSNVYERAVDFVYKLRMSRIPINDAFYPLHHVHCGASWRYGAFPSTVATSLPTRCP
jgi:pentatricopeptide repeat protein